MITELKNPFDLVKATDLTDEQIASYFVDFPAGASLIERVKPKSRMPMIIFGGKGSGKTHLMRYLTYQLQARRHGAGPNGRAGIATEGWLGIYFRCSGLNAQRFSGKGQQEEAWQVVFGYYLEVWLARLVLHIIRELYRDKPPEFFHAAISEAIRLLDISPTGEVRSLEDLEEHFETLQRQADIAINNCAVTRRLDIQIKATPGRIVYGLPQVLSRHLNELSSVLFLYLVDEYENLTDIQQRYVNTLLRERQDPCSFKVGVRLYGLRTKETLNAGEQNREDSEYDALRLDYEMRERTYEAQMAFGRDLIEKRLMEAGCTIGTNDPDLSKWFENIDSDNPQVSILAQSKEAKDIEEQPYFAALRKKLQFGIDADRAPGIRTNEDIERIVSYLSFPLNHLIERTSIFMFYRSWASRENLIDSAERLSRSATRYASDGKGEHNAVLKYFRSDIIAQLLRETKQKQRYLGFRTYVQMSAGLPRGLLTIMKHVFTWSLFFGEQPFRSGRISVRAQIEGVMQASEWFFAEARSPGPLGTAVRDAMTRLGELLRDLRFSDKPAECSLSTISADLTTASETARKVLDEAESWSMLLHIRGGQHDRNRGRVDEKYQVHPMLAPRWDLPISRRGALGLSGNEASAIFDPTRGEDFKILLKRRISRMTAPFLVRSTTTSQQNLLPGIDHE